MLERADIEVNGSSNGVGLVNHGGRHRGSYAETLLDRLDGISPDKIEDELNKIAKELRDIDRDITDGRIDARDAVKEWTDRQRN